jgi:hypothetical protein
MSQATLIKSHLESFRGDAGLYKLSPPMSDYGDELTQYTHVIVSAVTLPDNNVETYIFPADSEGNILDWGELPGSMKGTLSHTHALREAGYEIVTTLPALPAPSAEAAE